MADDEQRQVVRMIRGREVETGSGSKVFVANNADNGGANDGLLIQFTSSDGSRSVRFRLSRAAAVALAELITDPDRGDTVTHAAIEHSEDIVPKWVYVGRGNDRFGADPKPRPKASTQTLT